MEQFPNQQKKFSEEIADFQTIDGKRFRRIPIDGGGEFWQLDSEEGE